MNSQVKGKELVLPSSHIWRQPSHSLPVPQPRPRGRSGRGRSAGHGFPEPVQLGSGQPGQLCLAHVSYGQQIKHEKQA